MKRGIILAKSRKICFLLYLFVGKKSCLAIVSYLYYLTFQCVCIKFYQKYNPCYTLYSSAFNLKSISHSFLLDICVCICKRIAVKSILFCFALCRLCGINTMQCYTKQYMQCYRQRTLVAEKSMPLIFVLF